MADLKSQFEQAVKDSKSLPEKPDNMTLLKIYALYKQASSGDVEGKRPGFSDMVGRDDQFAFDAGARELHRVAGFAFDDRAFHVELSLGVFGPLQGDLARLGQAERVFAVNVDVGHARVS